MAEQEKEATLPSKENFSEWYNGMLQIAEIMDVRYPVKGSYVWYPFGFSIRRNVYDIIRGLLDKDHQETLFPLLIPENEFMKEAEHIKGFEEEVYWVLNGGTTPLDVKLALRPTSETAIYPMYRLWVRSHADLPLKLYQIVNTFRYETKHTRPLIRLREITSFKEAHTVHATWDEAASQVEEAIRLYIEFYKRLAIPVLPSKRPSWDKFPGADYTIAVDSLMPDGKTLQVGTAHHLGDNFAKTFDIKYEDVDGEQVYAHQTCYGVSERCIATLLSTHGDDKGLVLPPEVAPTQVVIIPIIFKEPEAVLNACNDVKAELEAAGVRVTIDDSDKRPGSKYYKWEMKGVPLRIEIGPRDLKNEAAMLARRDTGEKEQVPLASIKDEVLSRFKIIQTSLLEKATSELNERIFDCSTVDDVKEKVQDGIALVPWCGEEKCGLDLDEQVGAGILGIPTDMDEDGTYKCPICSKETRTRVYVARTY
ncbi:proline--tRNA ligase [Methanococcoides burtonii]|uniref:Proline--tRNA ligase n=1 Tax=Methanococcoides burtonii (strain DSM 6242 / NBRC 107633 / OCM 468 / ACE-M) TaxID=259564 RepID=SYP_METBU|nr:proline--tRNA ligase [Methanococcoides burtonii]Q12ZC6.1 RecName: Full=Proline--tRNA ligase; AltName: Full=Prolyl-tRNA synthetase; Short=ProRS [Methanococcoides burtonii DSM 6242]ABE51200.1 Prolyl-tRNA synthetase [Methanococcoides burtonii DSM 6242]